MEPISTTLRDTLVRQGLRGRSAGTESLHGMKKPGAADEGARRQVLPQAGEQGFGGTRQGMVMKLGRIVSVRPTLIIIDGGKR